MAELQTSRAIHAEKAETVAAVQKRLRAAKLAIVTEYRGLNVDQMTRLRREIRQASGEYQVIKNTLVKLALEGYPLCGPRALTGRAKRLGVRL